MEKALDLEKVCTASRIVHSRWAKALSRWYNMCFIYFGICEKNLLVNKLNTENNFQMSLWDKASYNWATFFSGDNEERRKSEKRRGDCGEQCGATVYANIGRRIVIVKVIALTH